MTDTKTPGGSKGKPGSKRSSYKPRKSRFDEEAPMTDALKELLMVDEDRYQIMNDRDSTKMGMYMVKEKFK